MKYKNRKNEQFYKRIFSGRLIQRNIAKCGDVESNPGPNKSLIYKSSFRFVKKNSNRLKFCHINCQSAIQKKAQLTTMLQDLGSNIIFALSETWLKDEDNTKHWELNNEKFKTFRCDRNRRKNTLGGGVMIFVPRVLNPKQRPDLNYMNKECFESIWIECNMSNILSDKNKKIINVSYNPKKMIVPFLEELSTSIDFAVVENKPITLMGDYNIDYLVEKEKKCLDAIIIPYGLSIVNNENPTRFGKNSKSVIDYIISDLPGIDTYDTFVSDTPLRNRNGKEVDHRAVFMITNSRMKKP